MIMHTEQDGIQPLPPPVARQRAFRPSDIDEVAALMAKRHSERMACSLLGIRYQSYANWKCKARAQGKLDEHFTRQRAIQFDAHVKNIEAAEPQDWRASKALIEMKFPELDPKNFQSIEARGIAPISIEAMKRVYASEASFPPSPPLFISANLASEASNTPVVTSPSNEMTNHNVEILNVACATIQHSEVRNVADDTLSNRGVERVREGAAGQSAEAFDSCRSGQAQCGQIKTVIPPRRARIPERRK